MPGLSRVGRDNVKSECVIPRIDLTFGSHYGEEEKFKPLTIGIQCLQTATAICRLVQKSHRRN